MQSENEKSLQDAASQDANDPLGQFRDRFHIPTGQDGEPLIYFSGNSLGLMPRKCFDDVTAELEAWRDLAVAGHLEGRHPWFPYHESFRASGARLVGAKPIEVVFMNTLTANLHFLLASFYRPTSGRNRILCDSPTFPSDLYALQAQARWHRLDPDDVVQVMKLREGESSLRDDDVLQAIDDQRDKLALVMFSGVNYYTGQAFDIEAISARCQQYGITFGLDLAHAAGNLDLKLHDHGVDFATWCTYKYGNAGPGAVAGAFVHERHADDQELVRLAGWWGNDPATRFRMDENSKFIAHPGAEGWQVSNPPIFSMAPLRTSLEIFDEAGIAALRERSIRLTGYLEQRIDSIGADHYQIITPRDPERRGAQISIRVIGDASALQQSLEEAGITTDFRPPDVVRIAPTPLYNTFEEIHRFTEVLESVAQIGTKRGRD